jgi:hypothetical protein
MPGTGILINGRCTGQSKNAVHSAWASFQIANGFVPGWNRLTFLVNNARAPPPANPTGLRVEMRGTVEPLPAQVNGRARR